MTHQYADAGPSHGHGLGDDLARFESLRIPAIAGDLGPRALPSPRRRLALAWIASSAGSTLIAACGGESTGESVPGATTASSSTIGSTTAASTASASTVGTTNTTATTATGSCVADAGETEGPYPADGTNSASGSTSDILTATGIVRSDIRSSFIGSKDVAPGVPLTLTLTLVNTNAVCSTLQGYAIYVWHCDRGGDYSLYSAPTESYLRGVQVTDSAGQVTFTTIFPACYAGRYPHIHLEVFPTLSVATTGRNATLTTQLAMPASICNAVYANATGYGQSVANFAAISLAKDNVFGDDTAAQLTAMTPAITGDPTDGYLAVATVGIAR